MNAAERFDTRYFVNDAGCWLWLGSLSGGYGRLRVNGRRVMAHRYSYERFVGPIPPGLTIDHLCRDRACVNPQHLEPVTAGENVLRGVGISAQNARKPDVCPEGHPYTIYRRADGRPYRMCPSCHYERSGNAELQRIRRQRRKERVT